jgi:hypothetical protein
MTTALRAAANCRLRPSWMTPLENFFLSCMTARPQACLLAGEKCFQQGSHPSWSESRYFEITNATLRSNYTRCRQPVSWAASQLAGQDAVRRSGPAAISIATASPPPRHSVVTASAPSGSRRSRFTVVTRQRAPEAPMGWPTATAPPWLFIVVGLAPSARATAHDAAANASLCSKHARVIDDAREHGPAVSFRAGPRGDEHRRPTVTQLRGVAGGDAPRPLGLLLHRFLASLLSSEGKEAWHGSIPVKIHKGRASMMTGRNALRTVQNTGDS